MTKIELEASSQRSLTTALRQYRHNDGEGFVFGYDKYITDNVIAGLTEDRDGQRAMKARAREQRDTLIKMLDELVNVAEEVIRISDRKHDAWDAAKAAIAKAKGSEAHASEP